MSGPTDLDFIAAASPKTDVFCGASAVTLLLLSALVREIRRSQVRFHR